MGGRGFDLDRAVEGVFELVQVVGVPGRNQFGALIRRCLPADCRLPERMSTCSALADKVKTLSDCAETAMPRSSYKWGHERIPPAVPRQPRMVTGARSGATALDTSRRRSGR